MAALRTFTLEGSAVRDIAALYDELNRVFMADESWRLGQSLDALDDLLYGGYGALAGGGGIRIVWNDHARSRRALGRTATLEYYREKLRRPETFNADVFRAKLDELEGGAGATYFDLVLDVFAGHPEIDLVLS